MKIDYAFLAEILQVFIDSNRAHTTISDIQKSGIRIENENNPNKIDEKFLFHVQIALDNKLISDKNDETNGLETLGIKVTHRSDIIFDSFTRLTQDGHDFANALAKKEILERLKTEFKDAPFKVVFDGSQKLLQHYFKMKLNSILNE